ncbi:MAG: hypothetical protein J0L64_10965 [Acidobacteria bacterium]|nr:hypothetical protein [Acidobacteriota bacterium]
MYDTSRADWTLEQHTASLACSVKAEGSQEWAACRQMVLHMLSSEKLHKELIAAIEADDDWKLTERLSREHSRSSRLMRMALRELMDLQTQRAAAMRR